jgi:hypothetical protein
VYRAGEELGYKVGDFNGDLQDGGFTVADTTTVSGRDSTLSPFLNILHSPSTSVRAIK